MLAATTLTADLIKWADSRYGTDNYDLVITSLFDILWQTAHLFRDWDSFFAREALYSWKPEHSAKFTITKSQKLVIWGGLATLALGLIFAPMPTLVALMSFFTALYTLTFLFKFVLTFVGASRKADMEVTAEAVAALKDTELPVYSVLVPMYREAKCCLSSPRR